VCVDCLLEQWLIKKGIWEFLDKANICWIKGLTRVLFTNYNYKLQSYGTPVLFYKLMTEVYTLCTHVLFAYLFAI